MPDVQFKDLVIDVTAGEGHSERVARFWAMALGQEPVARDDGSYYLAAPEGSPSGRVWLDEVPETPAGKSRVHIDVRVAGGDPAALLKAGGTVVREPGEDHWWVLNDPAGVPLCVFAPHPEAPDALGPFELVVDARDPEAIATWWAARMGGTVGRREGTTFAWVEGADGFPYMFWVFTQVPEPKTVKNRVHWDVTLVDSTLDDLLAAGATLVRARDPEIAWTVLADPEGNEFCVFDPR